MIRKPVYGSAALFASVYKSVPSVNGRLLVTVKAGVVSSEEEQLRFLNSRR